MSVATINWNGIAGSTPDANSCQITYAANDYIYDSVNPQTFPVGYVSTAIDAFITSHGWERITATSGVISTTAGMYAYRAANLADANGVVTYKYILLDFRTDGKFYLKVYESITTASVLTNLVYNNDVVHGTVSNSVTGQATYSGKLWISCSARHLMMHSYSNGKYGNTTAAYGILANNGFIGCIEITRPHNMDTAGTNSSSFVSVLSDFTSNGWGIQPPRTKIGATSTYTYYSTIITNIGMAGTNSIGSSLDANSLLSGVDIILGKPLCSSIGILSMWASQEYCGALFNTFMIQRGYGSFIGDDILLPVSQDSRFNNEWFYDPSSTTWKSYWLVGNALTGIRMAVLK